MAVSCVLGEVGGVPHLCKRVVWSHQLPDKDRGSTCNTCPAGGTPWPMAFIFVPLETISYSFRAVSLGVRLWVNMLAGNTLLHILTGEGPGGGGNGLRHVSSWSDMRPGGRASAL